MTWHIHLNDWHKFYLFQNRLCCLKLPFLLELGSTNKVMDGSSWLGTNYTAGLKKHWHCGPSGCGGGTTTMTYYWCCNGFEMITHNLHHLLIHLHTQSDLNLNRWKSHMLPISAYQYTKTRAKITNVKTSVAIAIRHFDCKIMQSGSRPNWKFLCWFLKEHSCIWIGTGSDRYHIFLIGNR